MVGLLRRVFVGADGLSGHVARIVMKCSRLFFARLLLIWILVVGHGMLLLTVEKRSHAGFVPRIARSALREVSKLSHPRHCQHREDNRRK